MSTTINLFPVPISIFESPELPVDTMDFIKNKLEYMPWQSKENHYLDISKSFQVLDDFKEFSQLKENTLKTASTYWRDILYVDQSLDIKIKHSWITRHRPGQYNRRHIHNNCVFILTTYLDTYENCGNLVFFKNTHYLNLFPAILDIEYHTTNTINCKEYSIVPENNMTVCFPSHLEHEAKVNNSTHNRYCLTVDFFIQGTANDSGRGFQAEFN